MPKGYPNKKKPTKPTTMEELIPMLNTGEWVGHPDPVGEPGEPGGIYSEEMLVQETPRHVMTSQDYENEIDALQKYAAELEERTGILNNRLDATIKDFNNLSDDAEALIKGLGEHHTARNKAMWAILDSIKVLMTPFKSPLDEERK